jgi:hypothetical protein
MSLITYGLSLQENSLLLTYGLGDYGEFVEGGTEFVIEQLGIGGVSGFKRSQRIKDKIEEKIVLYLKIVGIDDTFVQEAIKKQIYVKLEEMELKNKSNISITLENIKYD